jgi:hypothetical protein
MVILLTGVQVLVLNVLEESVDTRSHRGTQKWADPEDVVLVPDARDHRGTKRTSGVDGGVVVRDGDGVAEEDF